MQPESQMKKGQRWFSKITAAYMGAAIQSVVYGLALKYLGWNFVFYSISALCALSFIISAVDCRRGH